MKSTQEQTFEFPHLWLGHVADFSNWNWDAKHTGDDTCDAHKERIKRKKYQLNL